MSTTRVAWYVYLQLAGHFDTEVGRTSSGG